MHSERTPAAPAVGLNGQGAGANPAKLGRASSLFTNDLQRIADIVVQMGDNLLDLNLPIAPNGVVYTDPSTVPTIHAIAEAIGQQLPAEYASMTSEARSGEWLPEHLVAQVGNPEDH